MDTQFVRREVFSDAEGSRIVYCEDADAKQFMNRERHEREFGS